MARNGMAQTLLVRFIVDLLWICPAVAQQIEPMEFEPIHAANDVCRQSACSCVYSAMVDRV